MDQALAPQQAADLSQRVARIEAQLQNMPNCSDLARVDERSIAQRNVMDLYINRKDFHNAKLDDRVINLEAAHIGMAKEISVIKVFAIGALGLAFSVLGSLITGLFR